MLYHTYRPLTVDQIDNVKVRDVIKNYLLAKSFPHAWLFTGHKGMGKTSVARILARELNKTGNAAKDAQINHDIEVGSSPDVQEINGADNTGIDDIRMLIENISYAPMVGKYRMYIIDEVHMLSTSAFNGLLKILEEPPAHAIFILATTAIDKIPATIQSRCVRVDFGTASSADVVAMLTRIEKGEKITIPSAVKSLIASNCDRSFRDATKLLEELITQNALTLDKAQAYLGTRSQESLLNHLTQPDVKKTISWLYEYANAGGDMKLLIEDTLHKLHGLLLREHGVVPDITLPDVKLDKSQIVRLLKLFHEAYVTSRSSPIPQVAVQIAVIEYYNGLK